MSSEQPPVSSEQPPSTKPILEVENVTKYFPIKQGVFRRQVGTVYAVDGVSLYVDPHETLGVVGESGCGKTTLGRSIVRLIEPTGGVLTYKGEDYTHRDRKNMQRLRKEMQIVFQDPFASLDPRMPVNDIVGEPLRIHGTPRKETRARVGELLEQVGLSAEHGNRYPHEFSGGQRQRIGIARALALNPTLIVLDEPVSALDVSVQAQIINLLEELQAEYGLSYIFIAHDLSVVRHISHRVAVMYLGKIVEVANSNDVYDAPAHPYTQSLLSAVPIADPDLEGRRQRIILDGDLPSPADPPPGCTFHTRCPIAQDVCKTDEPVLTDVGPAHQAACHFSLAAGETLVERANALAAKS